MAAALETESTGPAVSMTAPSNGATVSGTSVTVSATASGSLAIAGVQFKLDGANLGAELTSSPYTDDVGREHRGERRPHVDGGRP